VLERGKEDSGDLAGLSLVARVNGQEEKTYRRLDRPCVGWADSFLLDAPFLDALDTIQNRFSRACRRVEGGIRR